MKLILIDVGNTRSKFVLAEADAIIDRRQWPTHEIDEVSVREVTQSWRDAGAHHAVLCSVVPSRNAAFRLVFGDQLLTVTHDIPLGIGIDYPEPASIGADRLANATALAKLYGRPGVAIDFGTAVTFDILSAEANYIGGVIAPGVEIMNDYMSERTALLPRVEIIPNPPPVGRSTEAAMQSGAFYGYCGMVRNILTELLQSFDTDSVAVVATGGASPMFAKALGIEDVDPDLTLHGLRFIAEANQLI